MQNNNNMHGTAIQCFMKAHKPISMADAFRHWLLQRDVREFLNTSVTAGVVIGDVLLNNNAHAQISPELMDGFRNLMHGKANSIGEIEAILLEKLELGDAAVLGLISKIKGQIGEDFYIDTAHNMGWDAHLAQSGSQEGWDVAVNHGSDATQYIQVKTYESADAVIHHMKEVAEKVAAGSITDGDTVVQAIDFAVPADIYAEVAQKAAALGLSAHVLPFDLTAAEAAEFVQQGFDTVSTAMDFEGLLSRFAVGSVSAMALHAIVTAYMIKKRTGESDGFLRDVSKSSVISSGGVATALLTETTLKVLGFATGSIPAIGAIILSSMVARGVFRRILSRGQYESWLLEQTHKLKQNMLMLTACGQPI